MRVKADVGSQSAETIKFCFRIGRQAKAFEGTLPDKRWFHHPDDERRGAYGGFPLAWHHSPSGTCVLKKRETPEVL
jgi:hypothetical protein